MYPISIHCRTIPYMNTLLKFFSHRFQSLHCSQALQLTTGVINSPRRNSYHHGGGHPRKNSKESFQKKSHIAGNEPTPCHCTWHPIFDSAPYLITLSRANLAH